MNIVPMRDLKDTVKIERMCAETKEPVFVTKNGQGCLVVMDINSFEKFWKLYEAKMLSDALEQIKCGETLNGPEALAKIWEKYDL